MFHQAYEVQTTGLVEEIRAAAASLSNLRGVTGDLLDVMLQSNFNKLHALADRVARHAREEQMEDHEREAMALTVAVIERAKSL